MTAPGRPAETVAPELDGAGQSLPPIPPEPEEDTVDGPSTDKLFGLVLDYRYSGGRQYTLTFDHDFHVTFAMPDHPLASGPNPPAAPSLSYRAREIRPDLFLVHWIVKQLAIHVALTIDLAENKLHVGAMMPPNRWEFFDTAVILRVTRS